MLKLTESGKVISENDYDILLANKNWLNAEAFNNKKIIVVDAQKKILPVLDHQKTKYEVSLSVSDAIKQKPDLLLVVGLAQKEVADINNFVKSGSKVLLLNAGDLASSLYPQHIRGVIKENGEIVSMEIPESTVFDGIEPMDIRYFNNEKRENPLVSKAAYQVNRASGIQSLAVFSKVHGYLNGDIDQRTKTLDEWKGFPIVKIKDNKGAIILSEVLLEKGNTDPIAGKLLANMLTDLITTK